MMHTDEHFYQLFLYKHTCGDAEVPFLGRKTMFSGRVPVSRASCLNFSITSALMSSDLPVKPHEH